MSDFNLAETNPTVSRTKVRIAYAGKNRKKFDFSKELLEDMIPTLKGTPVVAYYSPSAQQLGGHEGDISKTEKGLMKTGTPIPYGFVDPVTEPWWEEVEEKDGSINQYLTTFGYLWKERYPKVTSLIEKAEQSMEVVLIQAKHIDGYITPTKSAFIGLCALSGVTPTFESSAFETFSSTDLNEEIEIMYEMIGEAVGFATEEIKVSTNGEEKIEGNVGEKDISEMKKKVINASNRAEVIKKIFARYPSDLSGGINLADIGYPLMSERDGVFYYNTGFIKAASSRIEQNKDQPYYAETKANIVKARKAVGMPEKFTVKGDANYMELNVMKDMSVEYGMGKYIFIAQEEEHFFALELEEMKTVKMSCEMKEEMSVPMSETAEYAEDFEINEDTMMHILKVLHDMYMAKEHGYMSLQTEKEEVEQKVTELEGTLSAKVEEMGGKDEEIATLSLKLEEFALLEKQVKAKELLAHEDFSILSKEDKETLFEKVTKDTEIDTFKLHVESFSFHKQKALLDKEDDSLAGDDEANFSIDLVVDKVKDKDEDEKDIYAKIKEEYNF